MTLKRNLDHDAHQTNVWYILHTLREDNIVEINNDTLFESVLNLACVVVLVGSHCFFCE
jgi:hypothetical protein